MYRPPNTDVNDFLNKFKSILNNIKRSGLEAIVGLDHNLDLLKQAVHAKTQEFLECILDQNMLPTVTKPTRISKTSATLIDNILISKKLQSNYESVILIDDMSDHLPCILTLKNYNDMHTPTIRIKRNINNCTIDKMLSDLSKVDWSESLNNKNATESFTVFHSILMSTLNKHVPEQVMKKKLSKACCPWMSKGFRQSLLKSKRLYAKSLKNPGFALEYKTYMSVLRKCKRKLKLTYYQSKCLEFKNNGKKMWELINKINGKSNDKTCIIDKLTIDNIKYTQGREIANNFAKYFSTIGKELANKTMPSQTPLQNYLRKLHRNAKTMYFKPASVEEVSQLISGLKPKTSSGYDNISNKLLKQLHPVIIVPLTEIINRSLNEGCFPDSMKVADTIPLYKAKERDNTSNYRPISLLLTLSKILVKIVHKRTVSFLDSNNIIYNSQYGFREKHSTTDAVMELTTEIIKAKENHQKTISVFLDLSKAFDTLDPKILLAKMEIYGIRGIVHKWFMSYLTNRQLRVKCRVSSEPNNQYSDLYDVEFGTPQGSCLGPLLFLLFTNDLYQNIEHCSAILFADDTTIYKSHRNVRYLKWCIEEDLKTISDWFKANKLSLNLNKTVYVFFGNSKNEVKPVLEINNIILKPSKIAKFLGLWLDEDLNWNTHITKLINKIKRNMHLLQVPKNLFNEHALKIIYHAHIQSHISYGLLIWGTMMTKEKLQRLQLIQDKCINLITKIGTLEHKYKKLKINKLTEQIKQQEIKVGYRLVNKLLPNKISQQILSDSNKKSLVKTHSYNTRTKIIPNLPKVNKTMYLNSYLYQCIKQFMLLPLKLRNKPTLSSFLTNYKHDYRT